MEQQAKRIRKSLMELANMDAHNRSEQARIRELAADRRKEIDAQLAKLRPRVMVDREAAREYQDLVAEKADLLGAE